MPPVIPGSWTGQPQPHRCGGHCRWPVTQVAGGVSPSASLWTYTAASESAGSSVPYSFYFLFFFITFFHLTQPVGSHSASFTMV